MAGSSERPLREDAYPILSGTLGSGNLMKKSLQRMRQPFGGFILALSGGTSSYAALEGYSVDYRINKDHTANYD
jgi:hypothetical protein